jgi:hypothetical protein
VNYLNKLMVRVRESKKGQTMTEYVLNIAAVFQTYTDRRGLRLRRASGLLYLARVCAWKKTPAAKCYGRPNRRGRYAFRGTRPPRLVECCLSIMICQREPRHSHDDKNASDQYDYL